jgi:hypothetical protein
MSGSAALKECLRHSPYRQHQNSFTLTVMSPHDLESRTNDQIITDWSAQALRTVPKSWRDLLLEISLVVLWLLALSVASAPFWGLR